MPNDKTKGWAFRGKYCTRCNIVFEELPLGMELRHKGFPSFGLERQDCAECVATDPLSDAQEAFEYENIK